MRARLTRRPRAPSGGAGIPGAHRQGLVHRDVDRGHQPGVQVHGGMGFIEETGAAQFYRDARILAIYEGTTAIQANDLVGRKTLRDGGAVARWLLDQVRQTEDALPARNDPAPPPCWPAQGGPRGAGQRRGLRAGQRGRQDQRRVRRGRALPDAGRHHAGRLADGARAAGQPGPQAGRPRVPRRQDRHGAGLCAAQADQAPGLAAVVLSARASTKYSPDRDGPRLAAIHGRPA